ncbi:MAG: Lrp/AsnC family transcriptional regulator [Candidatus ainarchaeum sp.]|nr:Lrp/AsnC family transcriptional regulator [Candidatus ainarchaeum sp.]
MAGKQTLDELDRRILRGLAENGRVSARKLGSKIGAATSTVSARMAWLERRGVIKGYAARIDYGKLGYEWVVLVEIIARKGGIREAAAKVAKLENVFAVYDLTGETDCMAVARFKSRAELDRFVKSLQEVRGIERTITHIVLNTVKDEPDSPKP